MLSYKNVKRVLFLTCAVSLTSMYAEGFSGELRMDALLNRNISQADSTVHDVADRWYISRARLRYDKAFGSLKRWNACMEFHLAEPDQEALFKQSVITDSVTLDQTRIAQAKLTYHMFRNDYEMGLVECPDLTPSSEKFALGIGTQIGSILGKSGYHLGLTLGFRQGPFGGTLGIWQSDFVGPQGYRALNSLAPVSETITPSGLTGAVSPQTNLDPTEVLKSLPDQSFAKASIPYTIGGRVAYTLMAQKNRMAGLGLGLSYQLLRTPLVLAVLYEPYQPGLAPTETDPAVPAEGYYRVATFSKMTQWSTDFLRTYDQTRFGAAFSMQRLPADQLSGILTADTTGGAASAPASPYVFEDDGLSFGYYAEIGLLLKGDGYQIDRQKNAVSGIKLGQNAFGIEIGWRYGVERTTNVISLLNSIGVNDFVSSTYVDESGEGRYIYEGIQTNASGPYRLITVDNSGDTPYVVPFTETYNVIGGGTNDVTQSFKTLSQGWALYCHFYPSESTVFKMQFEYIHHQKRIYTRDNSYESSIHYNYDRSLQLRLESFF